MNFNKALEMCKKTIEGNGTPCERLNAVCDILKRQIPHYEWVGFYITIPGTRQLRLGPYVGEPTEHTTIPFGRGICGQAAENKKTFVVQDVTEQTNYLSCSPMVRSEIVEPVFSGQQVIGEIDIDSHDVAPFTEDDSSFLGALAKISSALVEKVQKTLDSK